MQLSITTSTDGSRGLLELSGVLDFASTPYLRQAVFSHLDVGAVEVTIDIGGLWLLDAGAVRVLDYLHAHGAQRGADVHLAEASGIVLNVLEIAGVAKQFGAYGHTDWRQGRPRVPLPLEELRHQPGRFPPQVTQLLADLNQLHMDDPGRCRARAAVVEVCLPFAHRLAHRYRRVREPVSDLEQVAALGLLKAVDGYDPARGIEFDAYAVPTIIGELKRHFRDRTATVRLPRPVQELRRAAYDARGLLQHVWQRSPSISELAEHLHASEDQLAEALEAGRVSQPLSLDAAAGGPDNEGSASLADSVAADDPGYDLVEYRVALRTLIARLPVREQRILSLRFYGNRTQVEIAEEVGLSQMHVSRLLAHALAFLRRRLTA